MAQPGKGKPSSQCLLAVESTVRDGGLISFRGPQNVIITRMYPVTLPRIPKETRFVFSVFILIKWWSLTLLPSQLCCQAQQTSPNEKTSIGLVDKPQAANGSVSASIVYQMPDGLQIMHAQKHLWKLQTRKQSQPYRHGLEYLTLSK